jgi:glycosyltransferase involved in cell wall biosynthesis
MILYFADLGYTVTILTSRSARFSNISTQNKNIKVLYVKERTQRLELPTILKLAAKSSLECFTHSYDLVIGGDAWGNVIAQKLSVLKHTKFLFFVLEYPQIITDSHPKLSMLERLENAALQKADMIVTHDKYHKKFLIDNFYLSEECICLLANSSYTEEYRSKSNFLRRIFNIPPEHRVILHSGGFGGLFKSSELVNSVTSLSKDIELVFHIGRRPTDDKYFNQLYKNQPGNVHFSLTSLTNEELDEMISSADIGIALYSVERLGYRAELMGLAAGKIGNYLKCGIPVIATKINSLAYLEDYRCGILITSESQLQDAIKNVLSDYAIYKQNAYRCYRELWHPQNYLSKINQLIVNEIGK